MTMGNQMNPDLETLQTHIAFQEHSIAALNTALIEQQKQIDMLRTELRLLKEKLGELEEGLEQKSFGSVDEKPPHY
jgi:SlyX protein